MSERVTRFLDFATGEITELSRETVPAASVAERFEGLILSALGERRDEMQPVYAVACDGCGFIQQVDEPGLPEGWAINDHGEFCPDCQDRGPCCGVVRGHDS
jgi:hypothetical protein